MIVSHRIRDVAPSITLATSARAAELRESGVDVANLSAGEPDFPTPASVIEATRAVFESGKITYTAAAGLPRLRDAVAGVVKERFGGGTRRENVVVTCGAKHALYLALQVLCDDGDEVLFASPYWVSYPEMARLAGAAPVAVPTRAEDGFRPDPAEVEKRITDRTRVLLVNSPSNPTGAVLGKDDLAALVEVANRHGLWVLSDEIYDQLYYGDTRPAGLFDLPPDAVERGIVVNGISKTYGMTGWRIGWAIGPADVVKWMARVQSHETSNANTLAQHAAIAAVTGDQSEVERRRHEFDARRRLMLDAVRAIPGVVCPEPQGAFYLFPKVSSWYGRKARGQVIEGSLDLSASLLDVAAVATVAGVAFGEDDCIRLSYATSADRIEEGVARIARYVDELE